jgi:agmatinase
MRAAGTLFGLPPVDDPDVVVLGLPFDLGAHPTRVGAREGPAHIRRNSLMVAEHGRDYGINPFVALKIADLGDVDCVPGDVETSYARIEEALDAIAAFPVTLGGDGAVTLPGIRAAARKHDDLVVLHFDSHSDAYDAPGFTNGNPFVHAARDGLIDAKRSFHIGVRDTSLGGYPGRLDRAAELGYQLLPVGEIGLGFVEAVRGRPVYVCWDMDVFDPSVAPGVVTPAWGGLTVREGLELIRALRGLDLVALDVNALSPPHDTNGQTGALAAHVILEFLLLLAQRAS